jgi:tripartite-type tricarboxylate transporter receptor subunit TctC
MVVGVSPGGGIDRTARILQKIIQDRRFVETPLNVVNKPGGGSTIAQAYLSQRAGDAHYFEISATSLLTNHIGAALIAKAAGADVKKLKVVVFNSGGEAMTALLGGHVSLVVTPSANLIPHQQSGRLRVLAVSAPNRLAGALASGGFGRS